MMLFPECLTSKHSRIRVWMLSASNRNLRDLIHVRWIVIITNLEIAGPSRATGCYINANTKQSFYIVNPRRSGDSKFTILSSLVSYSVHRDQRCCTNTNTRTDTFITFVFSHRRTVIRPRRAYPAIFYHASLAIATAAATIAYLTMPCWIRAVLYGVDTLPISMADYFSVSRTLLLLRGREKEREPTEYVISRAHTCTYRAWIKLISSLPVK